MHERRVMGKPHVLGCQSVIFNQVEHVHMGTLTVVFLCC